MVDTAEVRKLRAEEQWLRYDTIAIGRGAKQVSASWFETFAEFANAAELLWNNGVRTKQVGRSYCNQNGDTEDWAQRVYQSGVEFIAPPGIVGCEEQFGDAGILPMLWTQELPNLMAFAVKLQDTDQVLEIPGVHAPAGVGTTGQSQAGAGTLFSIAGHTGTADNRNTWNWPEPLEIPAKSKIEVNARIDEPIKAFLRQLTNLPAAKVCPNVGPAGVGDNQEATYLNWYRIRCWHRGPRYVQLRGARSAS